MYSFLVLWSSLIASPTVGSVELRQRLAIMASTNHMNASSYWRDLASFSTLDSMNFFSFLFSCPGMLSKILFTESL